MYLCIHMWLYVWISVYVCSTQKKLQHMLPCRLTVPHRVIFKSIRRSPRYQLQPLHLLRLPPVVTLLPKCPGDLGTVYLATQFFTRLGSWILSPSRKHPRNCSAGSDMLQSLLQPFRTGSHRDVKPWNPNDGHVVSIGTIIPPKKKRHRPIPTFGTSMLVLWLKTFRTWWSNATSTSTAALSPSSERRACSKARMSRKTDSEKTWRRTELGTRELDHSWGHQFWCLVHPPASSHFLGKWWVFFSRGISGPWLNELSIIVHRYIVLTLAMKTAHSGGILVNWIISRAVPLCQWGSIMFCPQKKKLAMASGTIKK